MVASLALVTHRPSDGQGNPLHHPYDVRAVAQVGAAAANAAASSVRERRSRLR